ncbi:hypothetical protein CAPTEDRAFT_96530 [Capitella teleta]|uniref:Protein RFT1 homolog n=1 Tax=Capitella teleta TaxID=283909 RepID=R7TG45_CAPTE|nr:hypothetical protein CAPTEDRAFT_96530 [Capitella teleta]|eukprot:ELT90521.1 hypothetical protein CAPTEDRAFT_96530 [Capitella teleta]
MVLQVRSFSFIRRAIIVLFQLVFRVLTFVLNAFVLRFISQDVLGIVNWLLTLLYTTVLFISREAFRRACLSKTSEVKWKETVNILWLSVPICAVFSCLLGFIWTFYLDQPDSAVIPHYPLAVAAFALSALIEMMAEPLYIMAQIMLYVRLKVVIEGVALALRCVLTVALVTFTPHLGLINFAVAQISFTAAYCVMYYVYFIYLLSTSEELPVRSFTDILPSFLDKGVMFNRGLMQLTWSFFKQSFLKQLLTEGERFVMTFFNVLSFGDQGVYDVINNLGSLVARFVFLPLEDASYLFFSQSLKRGKPACEQDESNLALCTSVLEALLKVVTLIGLTFLTFGFSYSYLLLDIYGGTTLSGGNGPLLLRWYCAYVLLLALNGISECFTFATMSQTEVDRYNHKMLIFSVVFLFSSWFFTQFLGSVGFILANCLNMSARITHSLIYTWKYFKQSQSDPLRGAAISPLVLGLFAITFIVTFFSEKLLCCTIGWVYRLLHIAIGAICLLCIILAIYFKENKFINFVETQYRLKYKQH